MKRLATLCVILAFALTACGEERVPSPRPTASASASASASRALANWCSVKLGDTKQAVIERLGTPNGNQVTATYPGIDSLEWDDADTILLASFESGRATNLQAYDGAVGPQGSKRIACDSFRSSG